MTLERQRPPIQEMPARTSGSFLAFAGALASGLATGSAVISLRVSKFSACGRAFAAELANAKQNMSEKQTQAISTIAMAKKQQYVCPRQRLFCKQHDFCTLFLLCHLGTAQQ